jgi:hypothetical protein
LIYLLSKFCEKNAREMARGFFSYDPKLTRIITTRKGHRNEILLSVIGRRSIFSTTLIIKDVGLCINSTLTS